MRRPQRRRTTRRRGLQNIGDVLASILTDIEQDEVIEQPAGRRSDNRNDSTALPIAAAAVDSQNTFSFHQPSEV